MITNMITNPLNNHPIFLPSKGACSTSGLFRRSLASAKASASGLCWIAVHTTSTSARSLVQLAHCPRKKRMPPGLCNWWSIIYYMGHCQYLVYSSKSSIFEECIIVFQTPAQFQKKNRYLEDMSIFPIIVDLPIENSGSFQKVMWQFTRD